MGHRVRAAFGTPGAGLTTAPGPVCSDWQLSLHLSTRYRGQSAMGTVPGAPDGKQVGAGRGPSGPHGRRVTAAAGERVAGSVSSSPGGTGCCSDSGVVSPGC